MHTWSSNTVLYLHSNIYLFPTAECSPTKLDHDAYCLCEHTVHDIYPSAHQRQKTAHVRMITHHSWLANSARFQEGHQVLLYHVTQTRGSSPKQKSLLEGPYQVVTWTSNVVYRMQWHPREKDYSDGKLGHVGLGLLQGREAGKHITYANYSTQH